MWKWIKKKLGIYRPDITIEYGKNNKEDQIQEIHCYKDGEYSHTVNLHYFTEEQFDRIKQIGNPKLEY